MVADWNQPDVPGCRHAGQAAAAAVAYDDERELLAVGNLDGTVRLAVRSLDGGFERSGLPLSTGVAVPVIELGFTTTGDVAAIDERGGVFLWSTGAAPGGVE